MSDPSNKKPLVVFVAASDFPYGLSAPYRIRMFAKCFQLIGIEPICVFQYAPGVAGRGLNMETRGVYDNIEFVYPIGTSKPPTSVARLFYYKIWGLYCVLWYILKLNKTWPVKYLFSYGNTFLEDLCYYLLSRRIKAKLIIEICDSPLIALNSHRGFRRKVKERLKYSLLLLRDRFILPRASYLFVISHWLLERYSKFISPDRILLTPIIGDADRFPPYGCATHTKKRIVWIGNFRPYEGLEFLIDAIEQLANRRSDFYCQLYGVTSKWEHYASTIQELIIRKGLERFVSVHDAVRNDEVPQILSTADVLVNPRTNSTLNQSNFPTKLVDYLLSGRPVVSSSVGEVSKYLESEKSVIFPSGPSSYEFAEAIEKILAAPTEAERIGRMGREIAEKHFDYRAVAAKIGEFISSDTQRNAF